MPVTLTNKKKRIKVYNLDTPAFHSEAKFRPSKMKMLVMDQAKSGVRKQRRVEKSCCDSLTLLGGERRSGLPGHIVDVPAIRSDIARGHLSYTVDKEDPAPKANAALAEAAAEPENEDGKSKNKKGRR